MGKTGKGRETRERLISTAAELFRRQGYDGTGLSQVVDEGNAPRGSLYFHFPGGKEELGAEAVAAAGAVIGRGIERLLDSTDDVAEAVGVVVETMAADLERSGYVRGCPVAAVSLDAGAASPLIREACRRSFERWLELLERRLRRGGWTRRAARDEAIVILAAVEGALTLARASHSPEPLRAVARHLRANLAGHHS